MITDAKDEKEKTLDAVTTPISKEKKGATVKTTPEVQDIDLGFVEKRKFRIGGDYNRILELNVSDMNIYARYSKAYPKLQALAEDAKKQVATIPDDDDVKALDSLAKVLEDIDKSMREQIDFIFDTNASEVCAPSGNMFDPVEGSFRFEHIINRLASLYETGFMEEINKFKQKTAKHTSKYQKKYHN